MDQWVVYSSKLAFVVVYLAGLFFHTIVYMINDYFSSILQIAASCSPAVDFFFRSDAWKEQKQFAKKLDSASVDDTSQVDIGLIVFWQVRLVNVNFLVQFL